MEQGIYRTKSQRARMTDEEVEAVMENFAAQDDSANKTWSRLVVQRFLAKYPWYFPAQQFRNAPSLTKAYAYYEHITLPRHFVGENTSGHIMRRAEPGESTEKTELYPLFSTRASSLIEWGIGVDLYFSTVRIMAIVLFVAGLLHLPNARYYAGDEYSPVVSKDSLPLVLQGTAICPSTEWVACVNATFCPAPQWRQSPELEERFLQVDGEDTVLILRNTCDGGNFAHGYVNWVVLFFLIAAVALASFYLRAREVRFDEDKLTSTDYSLVVKNPPPDALDPDEWRDYFDQFTETDGQVTAVTIALNNEKLVQRLVWRRIHRKNLRLKLPKTVNIDNEDVVREAVAQFAKERDVEPRGCMRKLFDCLVLPILRIFGMFLSAETLVDKIYSLTEEIKELQNEKYDATQVFVTFETEEGQRAALTALSVGRFDIMRNNTANIPPSAIFRDRVLKVGEPTEPDSVRWLDLSTKFLSRMMWRIINLALTVGMVSGAGWLVTKVRYNAKLAFSSAILVSTFNSTIPQVVKILMMFEKHHTQGSYQTSLYLKITLFRWVNTALLTKLLTSFQNTLFDRDRDVISQIAAIMTSELWLTPTLKLLDIFGNFKKHLLAPRARTQEEMNLSFQGTPYNLGERYTDLTKVLFVCFFYSALMPTTFFFGAAILVVQYYSDKFCLLRIWAWTPSLGNELAKFSRRYFFSGAVLAYAIISAYAWAQFPYDNVCDPSAPYFGAARTYESVRFLNGTAAEPVTVTQNEFVEYCNQRWSSFSGFVFPPTARVQAMGKEWMTPDQEVLVDVYGYTSLGLLLIFILFYFGTSIRNFFMSWVRGVYSPSGQDQHIDFSANSEIFGYVPQVRQPGFPFPFLACDIDRIDQGLIGWNDPSKSYDHYNLMFDVPWEGMPRKKVILENTRTTTRISSQDEFRQSSTHHLAAGQNGLDVRSKHRPIFSIIKHYPAEWALRLHDEEDES